MSTGEYKQEQFVNAVRGAVTALQNAGVDPKVFDMVMGVEYQTRNQWTSGRRLPKKPYVLYAVLRLIRIVNILAESDSFKADAEMDKYERRMRHRRLISEQIENVG